MSSLLQNEHSNLLLRRMAASDFALLAPDLEPFSAKRGEALFGPGEPAGWAYFLASGIGSLVAESPKGERAEAGLFGREGFGPTILAIGDVHSPYEGSIQMAGEGHRVSVARLQAAMETSATLGPLLQRFAHALAVQSGFTALSNAVHPVDVRLARWLLMCDDRLESGEVPITHEFMSLMLAVRRPSVTTALHVLEGNGLIRAERGLVTIRNRPALQEFAGDAYGKPEREYERLLGPLR